MNLNPIFGFVLLVHLVIIAFFKGYNFLKRKLFKMDK